MPKLRASAVSFLNARPLTVALEQSERIQLQLEEPSVSAALLDRGEVDVALLPVGALAGKDYEVVPGIAIGADGPVSTVPQALSEKTLHELIRAAGRVPAERDSLYRVLRVHDVAPPPPPALRHAATT